MVKTEFLQCGIRERRAAGQWSTAPSPTHAVDQGTEWKERAGDCSRGPEMPHGNAALQSALI